jgi:HEAT repeat protein
VTELEALVENRKSLRLIRRPHPDGARLLMAFHPPSEEQARGRVQAFVIADDKPPLLVEVTGPAAKRTVLVDHAEIMAASLRRVDVEATRAAAVEAAVALPKVARTKEYARIHELVTALTSGSFVPEAREALARSLPQLAAEEQVRAVDALAASHDAAVAAPLIKLYRSGKTRKRPAVREAILRALGALPDAAARKLLLGAAREKDDALATTAVRALGSARAHRAEVLRALVPLFKQAEAAGRSKRRESRERWLALRPAYETTLERLTGEAFGSAKDAQEWYRKHKADL